MDKFHPGLEKRRKEEKKLYKRLSKSNDDLLEALEFANYLLSNNLHDLREADTDRRVLTRGLNTALVISYARPFGDNRAPDQAKPTLPNKYMRVYDPDDRGVHDMLMDMRNKVYAHSQGDQFMADVIMSGNILIPIITDNFNPLKRSELDRITSMIDKLRLRIAEARRELEHRVYMRYGDYDIPEDS